MNKWMDHNDYTARVVRKGKYAWINHHSSILSSIKISNYIGSKSFKIIFNIRLKRERAYISTFLVISRKRIIFFLLSRKVERRFGQKNGFEIGFHFGTTLHREHIIYHILNQFVSDIYWKCFFLLLLALFSNAHISVHLCSQPIRMDSPPTTYI